MFMALMALIYVLAGLVFLVIPVDLIRVLNSIAASIGQVPMPLPAENFWLSLSFSMMLMLAALSWMSSRRPEEGSWTLVHLLSKTTSVLCFFFFFLKTREFPYLLGAVVDAAVWLLVFLAYRSAFPLRQLWVGHGKA